MDTMNINSVSSVQQVIYRNDEVHSVIDGDNIILAMIDPYPTLQVTLSSTVAELRELIGTT